LERSISNFLGGYRRIKVKERSYVSAHLTMTSTDRVGSFHFNCCGMGTVLRLRGKIAI
jgi:hypothetical protein